ncbi:reverse transcriptase domain-containing protein [Tanacetum coccineum]
MLKTIWSRKLDDALWAFRTAYKTPTGTTPYKLIYGKNCHLPFEIEHRAYWALKNSHPDLIAAGEKRIFQLHELDEFEYQAYENSRLYKTRTNVWHDRKLRMRKDFKHGNKVLLFHSKYKFKQPKLRSRWDGNEQIIFHIDGTSKHPEKHVNESIKMVNDTCEDSFERFTDEPALVCIPPPEYYDDEKEKKEVKNIAEPTAKRQTRITPCLKNFKVIHKESIFHSKMPQISSVFAITSALPKDSLIMRDEHLSTFRVEEIVPILRESEDTFDNNKGLDTECKDSYDSNLDESTFLVTPLFDSNEDGCLALGDDIEFLLHHDPSTPMISVASILEGFTDEPPLKENDDLFDLECKKKTKKILIDLKILKTLVFGVLSRFTRAS